MIEAVIFDSDGVLVDTEKISTRAYKEIIEKIGIKLTPEEHKEKIGITSKEFFRRIFDRRGIKENPDIVADEKSRKFYELLKEEKIPVFEGVINLIRVLREKNIKLAIATSASRDRANMILEKTGISKEIGVIITANDIIHGKPNPEIYLLAAKELGINPSNAVVIEDAKSGVESAKRAGMFCVAKNNNVGQDLSKADIIVDSIRDIDVNQLLSFSQNRF